MELDKQQAIETLFGSSALSYFEESSAEILLQGRNAYLGSLFKAERAVPYLNILYRMLLFKRDYELEPLYDDIFRGALAATSLNDPEYNSHRFRGDMDQLADWDLVSFRIEKQRLRGYRDNRKRKFRYRLSDETIHFLEWLEQRLLDDIHSRGNDTRDLLGEMRGTLGELLRLLHHFNPEKNDEDEQKEISRRVLFQLFKASELCQDITTGLADFNGRLLFFMMKRYAIDDVRQLIKEVESYVDIFLRQAAGLRLEILPLLERLQKKQNLEKLEVCHDVMEKERLRTPHLLQSRHDAHVAAIPGRLVAFFTERGGLDRLLHRINGSSLQVWQKLRSHLRELERKNNRLQDISSRMGEIATLPEEQPVLHFFQQLLVQPLCCFDPNYWDGVERAEPPKPKKRISSKTSFPKQYLARKEKGGAPVQSMDEARLAQLKEWIEEKILPGDVQENVLSAGCIDSFADYGKIMELARAGLLAEGKRLSRIEYVLNPEEKSVLLDVSDYSMRCPELTITTKKSG